jgi:AraC-like DNA-binding protein
MSYERVQMIREIELLLVGRDISLRQLAERLHVSPRTIQNIVRAVTGGSFRCLREQLAAKRVSSICAETPAISIKEWSFAAGFRSSRAFARFAKRIYGLSPSSLRSQLISLSGPSVVLHRHAFVEPIGMRSNEPSKGVPAPGRSLPARHSETDMVSLSKPRRSRSASTAVG